MTATLIWLGVAAFCIIIGAVLAFVMRFDRYSGLGFGLGIFGLVLFVFAGIVGLSRWGIIGAASQDCRAYEAATGRDTRLVDTSPIGWTCFALVDGDWYPIDQIYHGEPQR